MYNKSILARITDPACFACNIQLDILICPITWSAPSEYRGILRNLYNWHSSVLPGAGNKQFPCWSMWTPYIFALPKSILCPCAPILHWIISPGYCRPVPKNCCWNHEDYALFIPGQRILYILSTFSLVLVPSLSTVNSHALVTPRRGGVSLEPRVVSGSFSLPPSSVFLHPDYCKTFFVAMSVVLMCYRKLIELN